MAKHFQGKYINDKRDITAKLHFYQIKREYLFFYNQTKKNLLE